jgi:hypothetical protein
MTDTLNIEDLGMVVQEPPDPQVSPNSPSVQQKLDVIKAEGSGRWILFVTYQHQSTASNLVARIKRMANFEATHRTVRNEDDPDLAEFNVYVRYAKRGK